MITPNPDIRSIHVTRYVTPLREGGSLPAIVEGDDGFLHVLKFKGAGQGSKALIAELICGEIARAVGMRVPEIVFAHLDESFGRTEPDEEIQDLLKFSTGLNLGMHYVSGAMSFDPSVTRLDPLIASKILWLDALFMNVDRTVRNTNMLTLRKELFLIDHGACLYFHHTWHDWKEQAIKPFSQIKNHVLIYQAQKLKQADEELKPLITIELIESIVNLIPQEWIQNEDYEIAKNIYRDFLTLRLQHSSVFFNEALHAASSVQF